MTDSTGEARLRAIAAARAQGCTCQPDFIVVGDREVSLAHDDWCPLLRVMEERGPDRGPQILMWKRPEKPDGA